MKWPFTHGQFLQGPAQLTSGLSASRSRVFNLIGTTPVKFSGATRTPSQPVAKDTVWISVKVKSAGEVIAEIGLPGGRQPWFFGLWIEKGTGPRRRKSGGSTGSMPAEPFLRPAFDANKERVAQIVGRDMKRLLERAANG